MKYVFARATALRGRVNVNVRVRGGVYLDPNCFRIVK